MKNGEKSDAREAQLLRDLDADDSARMLAAIDSITIGTGQRPLPEPVLTALVGCVGDARKSVQRRAIDALAALAASGDARVVENLRRSVAGADRRARWAAAYALAQIGADNLARDIIDAVCEALSDDDGDVRWAAANILVRLGREDPAMGKRLLALAGDADSNA
ncbi:MAG TPA: HEAT repeat domain-containing protein, partial [Candidatus Acidoferrales bacterium]|nr:HEAT repeat domain-containing protein [Candidatus Acidoferrales bacterium]